MGRRSLIVHATDLLARSHLTVAPGRVSPSGQPTNALFGTVRTLRRALIEQSYRELDFTLGFPTRFSLGMMLGAEVLSLYGPDTEFAFGHLGFTNIIGWADPERGVSGGLITSGKPVLYPELPVFWNVMRTIGRVAPKVSRAEMALAPSEP